MFFARTAILLAAVAPIVRAHGSNGVPSIIGLDLHDRRAKDLIADLRSAGLMGIESHGEPSIKARADDRECGEGVGSCPQDKCCSDMGFCGTTDDHCYSPKCQWKYGPACPENQHPEGQNTSSIPRPYFGPVPYGGSGVDRCKRAGTIALTYDDGPLQHNTDHILDLLKSYDAKATFFVTGNNLNKGQIDKTEEHINTIKRMDKEGHQIASHTWTHLNLSRVSSEDRKNQIWNLEIALNNIIGRIPTYFRPPYSSCDAACQKDMSDLGYHLISFDLDTDDSNQNDAMKIQKSKDLFKGKVTRNGATPETSSSLAIGHDILDQTANNLTEYMLSTLTQLGYKAVTVGECLGDAEENWYRQFGDSQDRASNSSSSTSSSSDATTTNNPESSASSSQGPSSTTSGSLPEQSTSAAHRNLQTFSHCLYTLIAITITTSVII